MASTVQRPRRRRRRVAMGWGRCLEWLGWVECVRAYAFGQSSGPQACSALLPIHSFILLTSSSSFPSCTTTTRTSNSPFPLVRGGVKNGASRTKTLRAGGPPAKDPWISPAPSEGGG